MMISLTKTLLGGAAAAMIVGTALAPSAHANTCWWAGGDWNCTNPAPAGAVIAPGGMASGGYYIPAPSWGFDPRMYSYSNANGR